MVFWGVLGWGVFLRCWQIGERPFWRDEAWLADELERQHWWGLIRQQDMPPSPPLFAVLAKASGRIVATPEIAYRLPALLAGMGCIPLTYAVARALRGSRWISLAGMTLSANGLMLVTWSRELRQYEVEAFVSLLMAWLVLRWQRSASSPFRGMMAGGLVLLCAAGPWLGYATVLTSAVLLLLPAVGKPRLGGRRAAVGLAAVGLAVLVGSALTLMTIVVRHHAADEALQVYLRRWFIDWDRWKDWRRAVSNGAFCTGAAFLPYTWVVSDAAKLVAGGAVWVTALLGMAIWPHRYRRELVCCTVVPWLLMLVAAAAHQYPFGIARTMVFLAPPLMISVGAGVAWLTRAAWSMVTGRRGIGVVVGAVLTMSPAAWMWRVPVEHRYWFYHDFPGLLAELRDQRQIGDLVLATVNAYPAARRYAPAAGIAVFDLPLAAATLPVGGFDYAALVRRALTLAGSRLWVLTPSEELTATDEASYRELDRLQYRMQVAYTRGNDEILGTVVVLKGER